MSLHSANTFARFLEKEMNIRNISVGDLSQALNLSRFYIYKWLNAERIPSAKKGQLFDIAKVLRLTVDEFRRMKEAYCVSLEGSENRNIISNILGDPMNAVSTDVFEKANFSKSRIILNKHSFEETLGMVLENEELFSTGDKLYVLASKFFKQYLDKLSNSFKKLLKKGVNIVHAVPAEDNNLEVFQKFFQLCTYKSSGSYSLKYFHKGEHSPGIIYSPKCVLLILENCIMIFKDDETAMLLKYEVESFLDSNAVSFINEITEDEFKKKISETLKTKGNVYSALGLRHFEMMEDIEKSVGIKVNQNSIHKFFWEREINDVIDNIHIEGMEAKDSIYFRQYIFDRMQKGTINENTLVADEDYYFNDIGVYPFLKENGSLILCIYNLPENNEYRDKIILETTEKTIIEAFENFFKNILYKYDDTELNSRGGTIE